MSPKQRVFKGSKIFWWGYSARGSLEFFKSFDGGIGRAGREALKIFSRASVGIGRAVDDRRAGSVLRGGASTGPAPYPPAAASAARPASVMR
jgi:hypothetical protein